MEKMVADSGTRTPDCVDVATGGALPQLLAPRPKPTAGRASALALAAGVLLGAARDGQVPAPTFPAKVELVQVDVVVVDHDGQPVKGLTASDFEVSEEGRARPIVSFEPVVVRSSPRAAWTESAAPPPVSEPAAAVPEENRCFLVFFDDVHMSAPPSQSVRVQLARFLEREMRAGDWLTIRSPLGGVNWTARTPFEYSQIPKVIERLKGQLTRDPFHDGLTDFDTMMAVEYGSHPPPPITYSGPRGAAGSSSLAGVSPFQNAQERYEVARRRIRQTISALKEVLAGLTSFRGRKSVIFYSEGFIKAPYMREYDQAIDVARRAHAAIYFIDPQGLQSGLPGADAESASAARNPILKLETDAGGSSFLARATSGRVSISNDLTALFREAVLESSVYYLLGFEPSPGQPGERKLRIRVRGEGLTIHAPDRYVAGEPAANHKGRPAPDLEAAASLADAAELPLEVGTFFLGPSREKQVQTTVAVELAHDASEGQKRPFELLVEARPLGRGDTLRYTATVPSGIGPSVLTAGLRLSSGVWQARVVVRDTTTGRLGSVLHSFEVPGVEGLRLSTPILTNSIDASQQARLRVDRHYAVGQELYCQYEVFGATPDATTGRPRVTGGYVLMRGDERIHEDASSQIEPTRDGRLVRLLKLDLADLQPGDYVLRLRIRDEVSGQAREAVEAFSVGARATPSGIAPRGRASCFGSPGSLRRLPTRSTNGATLSEGAQNSWSERDRSQRPCIPMHGPAVLDLWPRTQ